MAGTQDYTKMMKDMMGSFPMDTSAMQDMFKTQATFADRMSRIVLEAAEKSTEISAAWTKETIGKASMITSMKDDPSDYGKAMTDFASAQAEIGAESMAQFAEVAKKVQMDTVELMLAAGKDFSEDASAAMKKATGEVTNATKRATAAAK